MFNHVLDSRTTRIILLFIFGIAYFILGIVKWNYILNPGITEGPILLYRYSIDAQLNYNTSYSDGIRYFLLTPKWISTLIYGNLFLFLNLIIIYVAYRKNIYLRFTFWLFFWVSTISFAALFLGFITNSFDRTYIIVARIKELQQSPFTLILMLAAFKLAAKEGEKSRSLDENQN